MKMKRKLLLLASMAGAAALVPSQSSANAPGGGPSCSSCQTLAKNNCSLGVNAVWTCYNQASETGYCQYTCAPGAVGDIPPNCSGC